MNLQVGISRVTSILKRSLTGGCDTKNSKKLLLTSSSHPPSRISGLGSWVVLSFGVQDRRRTAQGDVLWASGFVGSLRSCDGFVIQVQEFGALAAHSQMLS